MFIKFNKALNDRRAGLKREEGFTLIELLVVVIIIGILAAIAVPIYIGVQNNAKDSGVKSDLNNAKVAVVAYFTENNSYPTTLADTKLPALGYTPPTAGKGNYGTTGIPTITLNTAGTSFCVIATSVTKKVFGSSDTGGVEEATSCVAGVFTPKTP
jgi:type IV pilus assembly protein PilA